MYKKFNVIAVFDQNRKNVLMCKRRKDPYIGKKNLVGGKIEAGENSLAAAYRELFEETSVGKNDITLVHLMDFTYRLDKIKLEVFAGRLLNGVTPAGSENELEWVGADENFFDTDEYAGEGNIGHIVAHILLAQDKILK